MKRVRTIAGVALALLVLSGVAPLVASAQFNQRPRRAVGSYDRAYQIGFDEGYRRGYDEGRDDAARGRTRNPNDFKEYRRADDGYNDRVGDRDRYRIGFRGGFEQGYDDAVYGRQYGARPGQSRVDARRQAGGPVLGRGGQGGYRDPYGRAPNGAYGNGGYANSRMGYNQSLVIELQTPITTRQSQEGDRFSAIVVEPQSFYGARVEGYIGKLEKPGRVAGKAEMVLVFQEIVWPDGYTEPMQAQVEEVLGYQRGTPRPGGGIFNRAPWERGKNDDRNDDIDAKAGDEGEIEGESSRGRDTAVVGGGAAIGAVIGGVVGGGGGAAIGAAIGAATGGTVVAGTRGHHIDLEPGAQLRIRTGQSASF